MSLAQHSTMLVIEPALCCAIQALAKALDRCQVPLRFKSTTERKPLAPYRAAQSLKGEVAALCWRIMQLAAERQRVAPIPVFEPGQILSLQADQTRAGA
jgi:hypothetical protein